MGLGDGGARSLVKGQMRRAGRGVVCYLCCFSWGSWATLYTQRSRPPRLLDEFLDRGLEGSGAVDGEAVDPEVVILMILRLRTQVLIRARDMVMVLLMAGDPDSGVVLWEVLLLGIWLGTGEIDKSQHHREGALGLVVITAAPALLDALQAQAPRLDTRAQDLVRRQEGSLSDSWYILASTRCTQRLGGSQRKSSVNTFRGVDGGKENLCTEGIISSHMSYAEASHPFHPSYAIIHNRNSVSLSLEM